MSNNRLLKIDELTIGDHCFLTLGEDDCWYLFNYTAHSGFQASEANSIISNLKKSVDLQGSSQYKHKIDTIKKVAGFFSNLNISRFTVVPIPPSKNKADPLYDDRMLQIIQQAFQGQANVDIRELVIQNKSKVASHISKVRPTIKELGDNLSIDPKLSLNLKDSILLVDDVLTTGAHFIAIKRLLKKEFPDVKVRGLFICRRAIEDSSKDFLEN